MRGSSPLTRGKLGRDPCTSCAARLIPAHAGKTPAFQGQTKRLRAHPRSRGENGPLPAQGMTLEGSSPLTRGKLPGPRNRPPGRRLIPAHAGKTPRRRRRRWCPAAHPRSRGENRRAEIEQVGAPGSSPLTRGKLVAYTHGLGQVRLIPAHAGKTTRSTPSSGTVSAHPRSRGENYQAHATALQAGGSSPLTRGKPIAPRSWGRKWRLIPAHAGKTTAYCQDCPAQTAHPRSRGENSVSVEDAVGQLGSSPLTRGKLPGVLHLIAVMRLIPAHAGKTVMLWSPR